MCLRKGQNEEHQHHWSDPEHVHWSNLPDAPGYVQGPYDLEDDELGPQKTMVDLGNLNSRDYGEIRARPHLLAFGAPA